MTSSTLIRWSGFALLLGGVLTVLFGLVLYPTGGGEGAHRTQGVFWVPAHTVHAISGILLLFGLLGLYARQASTTGRLGLLGFALAFAGTALYVVTGAITAFVMPIVGHLDPAALEQDGAFLGSAAIRAVFLSSNVLLAPGYVLVGLATLRPALLPRPAAFMTIVGAALANIPVQPFGPMPWIVVITALLILGVGLAWLGHALWAGAGDLPSRLTITPKPGLTS
jgi:hypothetical protein